MTEENENKHEEHYHHPEHEDEHHVDYSHMSKKELMAELEKYNTINNYREAANHVGEIAQEFESRLEDVKKDALEKFIQEGGAKEDFDFKEDELTLNFKELHQKISRQIREYFAQQDKQKHQNLERKQEILKRLREITEGEENEQSIKEVKNLQTEWREIGPVPASAVKDLAANYKAALDLYYDNRSIYYELKELDRKKNLDAKLKLCEKAEALMDYESVKEALLELNKLHENFKDIGPVPKEEQEPLWQRFKEASDKLYDKRRAVAEEFKAQLEENLKVKLGLSDKVKELSEQTSDRINDWKKWSDEIKHLQEEWKNSGPLPKAKARDVTKDFWAHNKKFFANKNKFFKALDKERENNYAKKEALCEKAEKLKDTDDIDGVANELKALQQEWKEIGPVPKAKSDAIYERFRSACDYFFDRRRSVYQERDGSQEENLKKKQEIIDKINNLTPEEGDEPLKELVEEYTRIGFVPKSQIKTIHQQFDEAFQAYMKKAAYEGNKKRLLEMEVDLMTLEGNPHAGKILAKKRRNVRNEITQVNDDLNTLSTNIEFLSQSSTAALMKDKVESQIEESKTHLEELKALLSLINEFDY